MEENGYLLNVRITRYLFGKTRLDTIFLSYVKTNWTAKCTNSSIKALEENIGLYFYNMKWQGPSKHDSNNQKMCVSDIYFSTINHPQT